VTAGVGRYKDLCIDATSGPELATFYGLAVGLHVEAEEGGDAVLRGPTPAHTIWVNQVPEAKSVKHRVHLDLHGGSVAALEALGARVLDATSHPWTVMADPEGGELCLFVREEVPGYRLYEVAVDCRDHLAQSAWWQQLIGGERVVDEGGFSYLQQIPGVPFEAMTFAPVPEPKLAKNRIHLDVVVPSVDAVVALGGTVLRPRDAEIRWTVMADPEGNELCAFTDA
jgi:hypothetical protein